jgi:thiamine-phosphate pyrophosphorylase
MTSSLRRKHPTAEGLQRQALYRALDANANRAREGLRVAEDVARFFWDDPVLTAGIKKIRHGVTRAEKTLFSSVKSRLLARDVDGDAGRKTREASEKSRRDAGDLFRANLKRSQEALRSLEEFAKVLGRVEAEQFKRLRYAAYRLETQVDKHP